MASHDLAVLDESQGRQASQSKVVSVLAVHMEDSDRQAID